ncbi:hypothetical protein NDU88_012009 [Pleurodeles waltl]|uniref:Uncharacterized protein n=1 Tax=Pleurodeles waltl TaxID=8319 RepID=A0AAV7S3Y3_PLEWA|nr:hypothetical protein NDU88_012009 [Pleurodeles waltl]
MKVDRREGTRTDPGTNGDAKHLKVETRGCRVEIAWLCCLQRPSNSCGEAHERRLLYRFTVWALRSRKMSSDKLRGRIGALGAGCCQ